MLELVYEDSGSTSRQQMLSENMYGDCAARSVVGRRFGCLIVMDDLHERDPEMAERAPRSSDFDV